MRCVGRGKRGAHSRTTASRRNRSGYDEEKRWALVTRKVVTLDVSHASGWLNALAAEKVRCTKETARLTKMMDDGSVAAGKKEQFRKRLNALSSFGE